LFFVYTYLYFIVRICTGVPDFWFLVAMAAISIAGTLLAPKPKKQKDGSKSPDSPAIESGTPLPILWGKYKIGASFFYTTKPFKVTTTVSQQGGKGSAPKQEKEYWECRYVGYALTQKNPVKLKKLWINGEVVYDPDSPSTDILSKTAKWADKLVVYDGSSTQGISPELVSIQGSGNVPSLHGTAYLIIKDLNLTDYGNSYPTITVILRSKENFDNLGEFLDDVIEKSGCNEFPNSLWSGAGTISCAPDVYLLPFIGNVLMGDGKDYASLMQSVMELWQLILKEDPNNPGSILIDVPYPQISAFNIPSINLDSIGGAGDSLTFNVKSLNVDDIPRSVTINYLTPNTDFEPESYTVRIGGQGNNADFSVESALTKQQAATAATRLIRGNWTRKTGMSVTLPIDTLNLTPQGSIVSFKSDDATYLEDKQWLVTSLAIGDNGFYDLTANQITYVPYIYVSSVPNLSLTPVSTGGASSSINSVFLFDTPLITNQSNLNAPYTASNTVGYSDSFELYQAINAGTFGGAISANNRTATGTLVNALSAPTKYILPDYDAEILVKLTDPDHSFISVSETDWLEGDNVIAIDRELIGYRTAIQVTPTDWKLIGLIRGMHGSETLASSHAINAPLALVKTLSFETIRPFTTTASTTTLKAKIRTDPSIAVSSLSEFSRTSFENNSTRPLAPVVFKPRKIGTGWVISWEAKSTDKTQFTIFNNAVRTGAPINEFYRITIYDQITNAVITTFNTSVGATTATYTTASLSLIYATVEQSNSLPSYPFGFAGVSL
jgi:hypothetical protein